MDINQTNSLLTFYPDKSNRVEIRCPECFFKTVADVTGYRYSKRILSVTCKCGATFGCSINFGKYCLRKVNFAGQYGILKTRKLGDMLVENLSLEGVGFVNMTPHFMENGDSLKLFFRLDDVKRTEIRRTVKIVGLHGDCINTEFAEANRFDSPLGVYLKR